MYCRDCTTYTKDGEIICLNCARRIVSPKKLGTKYSPFSRYLLRRAKYTSQVTLSFARIEGIITDNLPFGAIRSQEWWKNTSSTCQGRAWLNVGWKVQDVDLNNRTVTLARDAGVETKPRKKRRRRKKSTHAFKLPAKPKRRRSPSKTKIAKVQARAKNVERRKSSMKRYKSRKTKAKTRDQYNLWDETAKPSKTKD
ncbi:MAG: hypothetical protein PVF15_08470 [Candidatus Bathyarchaeota archaeon]